MKIEIRSSDTNESNDKKEFTLEAYEKALSSAKERIKNLTAEVEELHGFVRRQTELYDNLKQKYDTACVANIELQKEVIKQTRRAEATSANEDPCADCDERDDCCADEENADEFTIEAIEAEAIEPALAVSELQGEVDALKYCFDSMLRWLLGTSDRKEQKD